MTVVICSARNCGRSAKAPRRKFCSDECAARERSRRYRKRKADIPANRTSIGPGNMGRIYRTIVDRGLAPRLADGSMKIAEAAAVLNVAPASVSRALNAYLEEVRRQDLVRNWEPSPEALAMLPPPGIFPGRLDRDDPDFDATIDDLTERFLRFRALFKDRHNQPYQTRDFHRAWIRATLVAIFTGTNCLILSPPRHGKTDLLIHFCVWLITWWPNIQILWVSKSEKVAKQAVNSAKSHLANNDRLRELFLPPGQRFDPPKGAGSWSSLEFTVATRTVVGLKSPTMAPLGRGTQVRSVDADFVVCDDIEDHDSTSTEGARGNTRHWYATDLDSRIEEHTAHLYIGSRIHEDDLAGHILEDLDDPEVAVATKHEWQVLVYSAHDDACEIPHSEVEAHTDCMLWPEVRTFRWLMSKLSSALRSGGRRLWELVYQNKASPEGFVGFDRAELMACRDDRGIGLDGLPDNRILVAGLDPSAAGYQAAFCWAIDRDNGDWYMVDLEDDKAGGIPGARDVVKRWRQSYGVRTWVFESNAQQTVFIDDEELRAFCRLAGVEILPHQTQWDKADKYFGVTGMRPRFSAATDGTDGPRVYLPFGTPEARQKTMHYIRQLVRYDGSKKRRVDVVMASWFPTRKLEDLLVEYHAEVEWVGQQLVEGLDLVADEIPWLSVRVAEGVVTHA